MAERVLYEIDGDRFLPTRYTAGPWSDELQHAGPPSALLARALGGDLARATFDIWRPLPIAPLTIETAVIRPGRKVQQLSATLRLAEDGTELMRATAWRLQENPLGEPRAPEPPPRHPDECPAVGLPYWSGDVEVAYHACLEWRLASGTVAEPGPACVWTRMTMPLVAGEEPSPLERVLVMGDAASGVSWDLDWGRYAFPNVDFSVHLERPPRGEWFAMDAVTRIGPSGAGLTTSVLHDLDGRIGITTQTLVVTQSTPRQ